MTAKKKSTNFKAGILVFTTVIFVVFSFYAYQVLFTANFQIKKNDKEVVFYINKQMDYKAVIDSMKKNQILHDELSFRFLSKLLGYPDKIIPGAYLISKDDNNFNVLKRLIKGRQTPAKLVFNNVRLKEDLAVKISNKLSIEKDSLIWALNNQEVCKRYGFDTSTIMCMFIPNTYEMYWNLTTDRFLDKMFKEYDKFWTVARQEKAKKVGLTQNQVQILASIVEAETQQNAEKARIAGV
ncbi:MAG TPA: endolytic transglycosylase MltG, partial [Cytophagales bacterium]|nr:endolytic transglycosylase MltG [Cytophagales bacterium]